MKSIISFRQVGLILLAFLVAKLVANYDQLLPHRWQTYTARDGSFTVDLPGKPRVTQAAAEGDGKPINLVTVTPTTDTAYSCAYADRENLGSKSPDEVLEGTRDGSLRKTQGTLISQTRMSVQGYPALQIQARLRGNLLLDSRIILANNRLYMVTAVAPDRESRTVQRVLDSFKIVNK